MQPSQINDIDRLKRINEALVERVEKSMDQQGNAFSLFQTAINLDGQVRRRTDELSTALRNLENTNIALGEAKEFAEEANLSKTRFLAAASHDVLQPLQAAQLSIAALAELQELQATKAGMKLVAQVQNAMDTMGDLIKTLLEISKLDAGVMQPKIEAISLAEIFKTLKSDFYPIAKSKDLQLRFMPCEHFVLSDRTMLRRILQNLISNALRYTQKGGILVGARLRQNNSIYIEIYDTGIGIAEEEFAAIFDEFHRAHKPSSLNQGDELGLGLGLSIVHRMAKSLNHDLKFSSKFGRGSCFKIGVRRVMEKTRPSVSKSHKGAKAKENALTGLRTLSGKRVLIIENDTAVLEAMSSLLQNWGCEILMARSMSEALANLELDSAAPFMPDFILADQNLDYGELGSQSIPLIREAFGTYIPALIVSANIDENLKNAADEHQIELLPKPLKPLQLRTLMNQLTKKTSPQ